MTNNTIELTGSRQSPCVVNHRVQKALLILHRVIPSDPNLLDQVVAEVTQAIERTPCRDDVERIGLAVREALANAMIHGNHCDCHKKVDIAVGLNESGDLFVTVKDSGLGFDPSKLPDPTAAENLLADHGRGLFLMRQLMDEVDLRFDHGTEVRMLRRCQWIE
jgi:anti-sigma regulatory factor (Ser/Thr protein kinase)